MSDVIALSSQVTKSTPSSICSLGGKVLKCLFCITLILCLWDTSAGYVQLAEDQLDEAKVGNL